MQIIRDTNYYNYDMFIIETQSSNDSTTVLTNKRVIIMTSGASRIKLINAHCNNYEIKDETEINHYLNIIFSLKV